MTNNGKSEEVRYIAQQLRRLEKLADLAESLVGALAVSDGIFLDITEKLDRLESAIMLVVKLAKESGRGPADPVTAELENQVFRNHIKSLQRQYQRHVENRDSLSEEAAQYGPAVPLHIANQIRAENVTIDQIKSEIEHFKGLL